MRIRLKTIFSVNLITSTEKKDPKKSVENEWDIVVWPCNDNHARSAPLHTNFKSNPIFVQ